MTNSVRDNERLLKRMTNSEFRDYLPHMDLEDIFTTEMWHAKRWLYLISPSQKADKSYGAYCHACSRRLLSNEVIEHLQAETHIKALKRVKQFYHPAFTYCRGDKQLMKGEKVSDEKLKDSIAAANVLLDKPISKVAIDFAKTIRNFAPDTSLDYKKVLERLVLTEPISDIRHMYADVTLPLLTLLNVEYSVAEDDWKPMLHAERPHPSSRFECKLCDYSVGGIKKVMSHLNSPNHKRKQLDCLAIRCQLYNHLTKNCIFGYSTNYSLVINHYAQVHYKDQIAQELNRFGDNADGNSAAANYQPPELSQSVKDKAEALRLQRENCLKGTLKKSDIVIFSENNPNKRRRSKSPRKEVKPSQARFAKEPIVEKYVLRNDGLVGVEYVIRILKSLKTTLNQYVCTLCDKNLTVTESRMAEHLIGYSHRMKYFQKHYNVTIRRYEHKMGHLKYPNFLRAFGLILAKLAAALEDYHGYGCVRDVPISLYVKARDKIIDDIHSDCHATKDRGPSFLHIISKNELKEFINNTELFVDYTVKHEDPERFCLRSYKNYRDTADCKGRSVRSRSSDHGVLREMSRSRSRSRSPIRRRSRTRSRSRSRTRTRTRTRTSSHSPRRYGKRMRTSSNSSLHNEENVWSIYRREVSNLAALIENKYVDYRTYPESHPNYKSEWNYFWKNRKDALVTRGIDHRAYNFQPEWVNYFKQRLETFFGEDLHNAQLEVRRRLNIPLDAEEDTPNVGHGYDPHNMPQVDVAEIWNNQNMENVAAVAIPTDNKPNVIHVLRLLTAFEDHLGSIGGKIMDLLSKALSLEKNVGDNTLELEASILTSSNCTLIETAAEKLKGILFAGLIDPKKVNSFNVVIQNTTKLLDHAEKMGYRNDEMSTSVTMRQNEQDMHHIFNVMQKNSVNLTPQKSLSDTLIDLISNGNNSVDDGGSSSIGVIGSSHMNTHNRKDDMMDKNISQRGGNVGLNEASRGNQYTSTYRNSNYNSNMNDRYGQHNPHSQNAQHNPHSQNAQHGHHSQHNQHPQQHPQHPQHQQYPQHPQHQQYPQHPQHPHAQHQQGSMGGGPYAGNNYTTMPAIDNKQMGGGLLSFDTNLRNPGMAKTNNGSMDNTGSNMVGRNANMNMGGDRNMGGPNNYDSNKQNRGNGPNKQGMGRNNTTNNYSSTGNSHMGGGMNNVGNMNMNGMSHMNNNMNRQGSNRNMPKNMGNNNMGYGNSSGPSGVSGGGIGEGGSGSGVVESQNNSGNKSAEIWRQY